MFHELSLLFGKALLVWLASLVLVPLALAGDVALVNADNERVAINGNDTVGYFIDGRPVKGDSHYEYVRGEVCGRFASAAQRARLASAPQSYAPQFGGLCAGALALGTTAVRADPDAWAIVDGKPYLNVDKDGPAEWRKDVAANIARANQHWAELQSASSPAPLLADAGGNRILAGHANVVTSVAFSPDGKTLASGSVDYSIRLWDVATGIERNALTGHSGVVFSVRFSPDGRILASGSADKTVRLWEVSSGRTLATLIGSEGGVRAVAFSPDGKLLASGGLDQVIRLWDVVAARPLGTLRRDGGVVYAVIFSPDGTILAVGSDNHAVELWDISARREIRTLGGHQQAVRALAFSPDGTILASGSVDNTIRLWTPSNGQTVSVLTGQESVVKSVAFSPNGEVLAGGGGDGRVILWDVRTRTQTRVIGTKNTDPTTGVYSVAFSPDGHLLAAGGSNATISLSPFP